MKNKVRFNLGKGKNYLKWKVETSEGISYYNPAEVQLVMRGCQLKNNRKTAEKIFNGLYKEICAWVLCDEVIIKHNDFEQADIIPDIKQLSYNPRKQPNWVMGDNNVDNLKVGEIVSVDSKLFTK